MPCRVTAARKVFWSIGRGNTAGRPGGNFKKMQGPRAKGGAIGGKGGESRSTAYPPYPYADSTPLCLSFSLWWSFLPKPSLLFPPFFLFGFLSPLPTRSVREGVWLPRLTLLPRRSRAYKARRAVSEQKGYGKDILVRQDPNGAPAGVYV